VRFTIEQYELAIEALTTAKTQHEVGNHQMGCSICGDAHGVDECGMNPLLAMKMCEDLAKKSEQLHETLHELSGYRTYMGETSGPARIVLRGESQ